MEVKMKRIKRDVYLQKLINVVNLRVILIKLRLKG